MSGSENLWNEEQLLDQLDQMQREAEEDQQTISQLRQEKQSLEQTVRLLSAKIEMMSESDKQLQSVREQKQKLERKEREQKQKLEQQRKSVEEEKRKLEKQLQSVREDKKQLEQREQKLQNDLMISEDRIHNAEIAEYKAKKEQEKLEELADSMVSTEEYDDLVDDYNSLVRKYNDLGQKHVKEGRVTDFKQLLGFLFIIFAIMILFLDEKPTGELLKAAYVLIAFLICYVLATLIPDKYNPIRWLAIRCLDLLDK